RALADAGQPAESKAAMDRFRQLGPPVNRAVPGGLVDYLSLTPEQQHADYRARVEKTAAKSPNDAAAQVDLMKVLLDDGIVERAVAAARQIATLKPGAAILAEAGRALLESNQFVEARNLLELAARTGASPDVVLDLALAVFHAEGAR